MHSVTVLVRSPGSGQDFCARPLVRLGDYVSRNPHIVAWAPVLLGISHPVTSARSTQLGLQCEVNANVSLF
jgi:hypothetical protein